MNDDYRLAVSRWLLGMSVDTIGSCVRQAEQQDEPYVLALATVRLAMDSALDEPSSARDALAAADAIAASYDSQYIRDYALAARGAQAIVFGDLSVASTPAGASSTAPTRPMQVHGFLHLARAGLLCRDEAAVTAALDAGETGRGASGAGRDGRSSTSPLAFSVCSEATSSTLVRNSRSTTRGSQRATASTAAMCRAARSAIASLQAGGDTCQAMAHALAGLVDDSEDQWHEALRLADEHGLRLIAVDALEALAAAAAAGDSFVEALRLCAAAERLRGETGYEWRWPGEQRTYDDGLRAARDGLGEAADQAWNEGLTLEWHEAAAYARRARGERGRPNMAGPASLRPSSRSSISSPRA